MRATTIGFMLISLSLLLARGQSQKKPFTITVDTQLVVETVAVKDKSGKDIVGLTQNDFIVTEDGKPQTIALFDFQRLDDVAVSERPANNDGDHANRRFLVFFFDLTAMSQGDQLRACAAAEKFVRTEMKAPDLIAIMTLNSRLSLKQVMGFTGDRNRLLETLRMLCLESSRSDTDVSVQENDDFNIFNTDRKLSALQTTANQLRQVNGQKSLIYFASGLQLNDMSNRAQLAATVNAAIRANIAVFPVDARGLTAIAPIGDASRPSPGGAGMYSGEAMASLTTRFKESGDTLFALAAQTGGRATLDSNDLVSGIVQAQQAITSYYIIGYYPANSALDGKFRRVSINLKRTPFAKLAYRPGYYVAKTFDKFNAFDKERQLEDALALEDPIMALTIGLEVNYFQLNRAEYIVPVTINIPGSELLPDRHEGLEHAIVDFIGEVKDEHGRKLKALRDNVDIKLAHGGATDLLRRRVHYQTTLTLPPGRYTIKTLARANLTGRMGTYERSFVIPDLAQERDSIRLSSVVLSSQLIDVPKARSSTGIVEPLVVDGKKLVPGVTRVFSTRRPLYVYLECYRQDMSNVRPVVAFVTFYREQTLLFETQPIGFPPASKLLSRSIPLNFNIPLSEMPPGTYDIQVTVLDPIEEKLTIWRAPILLIP